MTDVEIVARALAEQFHEIYERLAPSFGYETRKETQQFDPSTPNGRLMIAVCGEMARERAAALAAATPLIEARVRDECAKVADGFDAPHLNGVGERIAAAIRKG